MLKFLELLFIGDTFNTRIKVTFVDVADNSIIAEHEFEQQYLPENFEPPLYVFIGDMEWILVRAHPEHANQYTFDKKLTVWLKNPRVLSSEKVYNNPAEKNISFGTKPPHNANR